MEEPFSNWMRQAKRDYQAAQANLKSGQYFVCVFLCQQSSEKALKALILKKTKELINSE